MEPLATILSNSPLLVQLLEQVGIDTVLNGGYDLVELLYDPDTNQYYGELKLTLSNTIL